MKTCSVDSYTPFTMADSLGGMETRNIKDLKGYKQTRRVTCTFILHLSFKANSPVILWLDLQLIATEALSSPVS